jgi:hypothetical protein
LLLVWRDRTLLGLAWVAGVWQILHHMQMAVLILFATRELGLSAGLDRHHRTQFGGLGCVLASAFAERLSARFGVGPVIIHGLTLTALAWQTFGLISGPVWLATLIVGGHDAGVRFRRRALRDQLPGTTPGDHARSIARPDDRDDAVPDGRGRTAGLARRRRARDCDRDCGRRC